MPLLEVCHYSAAALASCTVLTRPCTCLCLLPAENEYTQTYYLAMSGPSEAFTSLSNPANMRTVATTLHETLGLSDSYSPNNIKVWLESSNPVSPTASRHLLGSTQLVMLGYALAKQSGLPEASKLTAMVADASMGTKLVQGLAAADLLPTELLSQIVAISIIADNAEHAVTQLLQAKVSPFSSVYTGHALSMMLSAQTL
jgi:hypothetical protein